MIEPDPSARARLIAARTRSEQGLPELVADLETLARVAVLVDQAPAELDDRRSVA